MDLHTANVILAIALLVCIPLTFATFLPANANPRRKRR